MNKYFSPKVQENQDIGRDTGTPVTYTYKTPFEFEGTIENVVVELKN